MHATRIKVRLPIFAAMLIVALTLLLFGSAPAVSAQDEDPGTPTPEVPAQNETPTPTPEVEAQIVGGSEASLGEYPWQVALVGHGAIGNDFYYGDTFQFCSASLIHPQWVLTAAHCVTEDNGTISNANTIDAVAGLYHLYPATSGFQRRAAIQIIRHPAYVDNNTFNNDLALIKLSSPIVIGGSGETMTALIPLVQPANGSLAGMNAWASGWGNIKESSDEDYPFNLHDVELPIMSNATCNNSSHWGYGITANMICAGDDTGERSTCQGDSGGPLAIQIAGQWDLAGIVSFGPVGCAVPRLPSVMTRVSQYVSWIYSSAGPLVVSSTRASGTPSSAGSVNFTVTFSKPVTGVDAADFALTTTGVSGTSINGAVAVGLVPATSWIVSVNTGTGNGTIRLDVASSATISDSLSNSLGGVGFTTGQTYTIDRVPPSVITSTRLNDDNSAAPTVSFLVSFSESIIGTNPSDFSLNTTGVSGASITSVNGTGPTRTVLVNTGIGDGTIHLDLADDDSITDLALNSLGGPGDNADFTSGETYAINKPDLPAPLLRSPRDGLVTVNTTPTFWWTGVKGAGTYEIEFAADSGFTTGLGGATGITGTSYNATTFVDGLYYWHIRAHTPGNQAGSWSVVRTLTIDTTGPAAPALTFPADSASTRTPTFKWLPSPTAVMYQFQYDDDSGFATPNYTSTVPGTSRRPPAMHNGTFYWQVRARDAAGNWGAWSTPFTVNITGP